MSLEDQMHIKWDGPYGTWVLTGHGGYPKKKKRTAYMNVMYDESCFLRRIIPHVPSGPCPVRTIPHAAHLVLPGHGPSFNCVTDTDFLLEHWNRNLVPE